MPVRQGIDVGAKEHLRTPRSRAMGSRPPTDTYLPSLTPELHELAGWLERCGIKSVALESTGIYWLSLYEVLEQCGFDVRVSPP